MKVLLDWGGLECERTRAPVLVFFFLFVFGIFCLTIHICTIRRVDGVFFPLKSGGFCQAVPQQLVPYILALLCYLYVVVIASYLAQRSTFLFSTIVMHRGIIAYLVLRSCDHVGS